MRTVLVILGGFSVERMSSGVNRFVTFFGQRTLGTFKGSSLEAPFSVSNIILITRTNKSQHQMWNKTPLLFSESISSRLGCNVYLKLEASSLRLPRSMRL